MATIDVIDGLGAHVALEKPLVPGRAAAATSRPVALSNEDKTALDLVASNVAAATITLGTAGSPPGGTTVLSVQGVASGTPQPISNTPLTNFGAGEYETVAASQTAQALGATGATGDYISGILVIPATTSPGVVTLLHNATSIPVFVGGASSVSNLVPFFIPLGMISVSGAWKITTGANVSCIGVGNFT